MATSKKSANKKVVTGQAGDKKVVRVKVKTATAGKKAVAEKPAVGKKKAVAKKAPEAKKQAAAKTVAAAASPAPKRRQRITEMTVQEVLISLESLRENWSQFDWLDGLILYGPGLRRVSVHRQFSFMVLYSGLRGAAQVRQAKVDLGQLLKDAIPIQHNLHFLNDPSLLDRIVRDDPAFLAIFGHAITVYLKSTS